MHTKTIAWLLGSIFILLSGSRALGQVQRTFVSGLGSDSNPCSRVAPCRSLIQAIAQTSAGGEVVVLDSAGYGPFTVGKSISVIAPPGVYAGISVFSGDGIDIAVAQFDTVILRGLTVNNQGSAGSGIAFSTGGTLHVEGCVISGFSGAASAAGLSFNGAGGLEAKDSIVRGNSIGISVQPTAGTASAAIEEVRLEANTTGLRVQDGSSVTMRNSTASANSGVGLLAISNSSANVQLNVEGCVVSGNGGSGIVAESISTGVATIRISDTTVTDNLVGLNNIGSPAVILSRANNTVEGNTVLNTNGAIGSYAAK